MSATAVNLVKRPAAYRRPAGRLPIARLAARQLRWLALVLLLPVGEIAATLLHRYSEWSDAESARARVGNYAYHFTDVPYNAHTLTDRLFADGQFVAFVPALCAAALTAILTAREWESRRVAVTLTQSVSPIRWFTVHWGVQAALTLALTMPLVVLYRLNAAHAYHEDLLVHGAYQATLYFIVGPVTLAYVLLGVAAGAFVGTALRRTLPALLAAPALLWLLVGVLVRARLAALLDYPVFSETHGFHAGGVLGLQFFHLLPKDDYLVNSLTPGDYWPYQLAQTALVLALTAALAHSALRIVRRRTGRAGTA
ncbi:hypothetical protein LRD69_22465 [Streptomyces sp. JH14]|uniref:hypothetical protein n=1 Tax=Streptomyces sp. JH14 TaxID=2793630 RepID=UPI0023F7024C|nr:hypothetical protein [Streptomyces sp. JH14]MDF6044858.1 hypothetical protein [Streptomyces sp. JH14]